MRYFRRGSRAGGSKISVQSCGWRSHPCPSFLPKPACPRYISHPGRSHPYECYALHEPGAAPHSSAPCESGLVSRVGKFIGKVHPVSQAGKKRKHKYVPFAVSHCSLVWKTRTVQQPLLKFPKISLTCLMLFYNSGSFYTLSAKLQAESLKFPGDAAI